MSRTVSVAKPLVFVTCFGLIFGIRLLAQPTPTDGIPAETATRPAAAEPLESEVHLVDNLPLWLVEAQQNVEIQEQHRHALNNVVTLQCTSTSLHDVVQALSQQCATDVYLNVHELEQLGFDPETPVRFSGSSSLSEILDLLLEPRELSYKVREIGIEISSKAAIERAPTLRYYDLEWVTDSSDQFQPLLELIQKNVAPDAWSSAGGANRMQVMGSILIVSAPATTQREIEKVFANLRHIHAARHSHDAAGEVAPVE